MPSRARLCAYGVTTRPIEPELSRNSIVSGSPAAFRSAPSRYVQPASAEANDQIARVKGNGQSPNDLLDKRDQLIRELNQYIQTTQIPADDGALGVFVGGSQARVLGSAATAVSVGESQLFPGSGQTR